MGRLLADGTWKPKPSALKESSRMAGSTKFESALRRGTLVKVFMGAGWQKANVVEWSKDRCVCKLARGGKTVVVYDARNLILEATK